MVNEKEDGGEKKAKLGRCCPADFAKGREESPADCTARGEIDYPEIDLMNFNSIEELVALGLDHLKHAFGK